MGSSPGKWIKATLFRKKSSKSSSSKRNSDSLAENSRRANTNVAFSGTHTAEKERAVIKIQAVYRGYMARKAFQTLRGRIIRLQAIIRGHLVRRQALATLLCIQTIIKFQTRARGLKYSKKAVSFKVFLKESSNAFVCKLVSMKTFAPVLALQMHYFHGGPNSTQKWLERWTYSQIWKPIPQARKKPNRKPRMIAGYAMETESGRSKRVAWKNIPAHSNSGSTSIKARNKFKKVASLPAVVEVQNKNSPGNELGRVKRNLRKVASSVSKPGELELAMERPKLCVDVPEPESVMYSKEKGIIKNSGALTNYSRNELAKLMQMETKNSGALTNCSRNELAKLMQMETTTTKEVQDIVMVVNEMNNEDTNLNNEEQVSQEPQKTSKRRSLPKKMKYPKDFTQSTTPTLPSYMMPTISALAKLNDKYGFARRNYLAFLNNGKRKSVRFLTDTARVLQTDCSLIIDDEPVLQFEWRP